MGTYLGLCDFHLLLRHCTAAALGTAAAAACARNHKPVRMQNWQSIEERSGVTKRPAAKGEESRQAYLAARSSCAWSARAGRPGGADGCAQSRADRCHAAVTCHPQDIPTQHNTLLFRTAKKKAEKGDVRLLSLLSRSILHLERLIDARPVRLERVLRLHLDVLLVREEA